MRSPVGFKFTLAFAACCLSWSSVAAEPRVVVTIKPIHSLVAGVMDGVGTPTLLIQGGGSPHSYSLRPSEARALSRADLVFWVGEEFETFLNKPLAALARPATVVALSAAPGVRLLESREAGAWEPHDEHETDDEHEAHDEHKAHAEAKQETHDHEADGQEGHKHGEHNLHIWLGPENAQAIVRAAAAALGAADPEHAARYGSNATELLRRIERESREIATTVAPVSALPYVVFHDAYPYFEQHYGLNAVGSITVSPERQPGAKRLGEIRAKVVALGAVCVFSEPQFQSALIDTIIEGTTARAGVLDPLGADLAPGPEAYFQIMRGLAEDLRHCLAPAS